MNCEEARLQFAAVLEGAEEPAHAALDGHLEGCAACREELDTLRTHWAALGLLRDVEPGPNLRRGFYQALEAYQEGLAQRGAPAGWWRGLFAMRPAFQAAAAALLLAVGAGIGYVSSRPAEGPREVTQLRSEIGSLRQLVALSLLQQQSAVGRLQGVSWASRVEPSDSEVLEALLRTIDEDASIDVRLAAVDALAEFGNNPAARKGLTSSLARQTSPLMQIALIDLLVRFRERTAVEPIRQLVARPELNQTVRTRAESALRGLE